jgi:hypothetical protein
MAGLGVIPMSRFAIVTPPLDIFPHALAYREVALTVHHGLIALGHESVRTNELDTPGWRSIVLGIHNFAAINQQPPHGSIIYQLEQYPWALRLDALGGNEVWDFSEDNISRLKGIGIHAKHVPIGYVPELTRITLNPNPDIDVLFYGCISPRRAKIIGNLMDVGLNVTDLGADYDARDACIARSKVVLNMHYADEPAIFEVVRVSYALANRAFVVSERGAGWEPFEGGVLFTDYENLVEWCVETVDGANGRRATAERGFEIITSPAFDERAILEKALR